MKKRPKTIEFKPRQLAPGDTILLNDVQRKVKRDEVGGYLYVEVSGVKEKLEDYLFYEKVI